MRLRPLEPPPPPPRRPPRNSVAPARRSTHDHDANLGDHDADLADHDPDPSDHDGPIPVITMVRSWRSRCRVTRSEVLCKPWVARNSTALFTKKDFHVDMRRLTITCPAGEEESFTPGATVEFDPETCARCRLRAQCTMATAGGRTVTIAEDERLQHRLRKLVATPAGRRRLRERVVVEHRLAHVGQRQGRRARYFRTRANLFDLRRACAVQNLETAHQAALKAA